MMERLEETSDYINLLKHLSSPINARQYLLSNLAGKCYPLSVTLMDDKSSTLYMIQQNVEELYVNDIELISRKILSASQTSQTYASLCEEILSSSTNSKKLLFHSITLLTILQKVFLSLGKNEVRSIITTQSINSFCRTLNKAIVRMRFQTVTLQILYVLVTLLLFSIISLWLQHNG
jgi:hypothetical protein